MSYFRPQKAGKIGPRTVHSFLDSTSRLSQNAGQVNLAKCALSECLKLRVQSSSTTVAASLRIILRQTRDGRESYCSTAFGSSTASGLDSFCLVSTLSMVENSAVERMGLEM